LPSPTRNGALWRSRPGSPGQLGLLDAVAGKFVVGENIGQTYQFAASGNADLGFVALSQIMQNGKLTRGSMWLVPSQLYSPIRQDAPCEARRRQCGWRARCSISWERRTRRPSSAAMATTCNPCP